MSLLSEVLERFTKGITVTIPIDDVTAGSVEALSESARKHRGKSLLRIRIEDKQGKMQVDLPSRKFRVNPKEMVPVLSEFSGFEVRIIHD
jgi:hypothetical protein